MRKSLRTTIPVIAVAMTLTLAGCGQDTDPAGQQAAAPTTTSTTAASTSDEAAATDLSLADGWAKAMDTLEGDHPMTGIFGTLTNPTDADVHLTGGSSPAAGNVELHETVMSGGSMVMREAADGFVIPAGGTFVLEPGANHIMLMELTGPIPAGTEVQVTLAAADGSEFEFTVPARTFAGAQETYAPGHGAPEDGEHGEDHPSDSGTSSS